VRSLDQLARSDFGSRSRVALTNLDKVFWPARDSHRYQRDLIRFTSSGPWLPPHLRTGLDPDPPQRVRPAFYQKHYEQPIPSFVRTQLIWSEQNRGDGEYILCNNLPTLIWLAQLADLEMHAWMARVEPEPDAHGRTTTFSGSEAAIDASVLNYPDFMVFDLDPYIYSGRETGREEPEYNHRGWEKTVEIALSLKELLDQLKVSFEDDRQNGPAFTSPSCASTPTTTCATSLGHRTPPVGLRPRDVTMEWTPRSAPERSSTTTIRTLSANSLRHNIPAAHTLAGPCPSSGRSS
jgi:bifunctional non-homologous end joining protein LigD